jgi:hypothetical protein
LVCFAHRIDYRRDKFLSHFSDFFNFLPIQSGLFVEKKQRKVGEFYKVNRLSETFSLPRTTRLDLAGLGAAPSKGPPHSMNGPIKVIRPGGGQMFNGERAEAGDKQRREEWRSWTTAFMSRMNFNSFKSPLPVLFNSRAESQIGFHGDEVPCFS